MDPPDSASANPTSPCHSARPASFLDVLRELDLHALDTLYDHLQAAAGLGVARLACHALRRAIDGSVRHAQLTVRPATARRWEPGQLSPLARFPRCTAVTVALAAVARLDDAEEDFDTPALELAAFMSLSLAGMDTAASLRITSLTLCTGDWALWCNEGLVIDALLTDLTFRLPSLRTLDLHSTGDGWPSVLRTTAMYDRLAAACPQLESLVLPEVAAVPGVGALRGSLKELDVGNDGYDEPCTLTRLAVASIAQLTRLQRLKLQSCADSDAQQQQQQHEGVGGGDSAGDTSDPNSSSLRVLLDCVPASLQQLLLASVIFRGQPLPSDTLVELELRRIQALKTEGGPTLSQVNTLASLLLASRALPPLVPLLTCDGLYGITRTGLAYTPLRELLARCGRVEVGTMVMDRCEPAGTLPQAVRLGFGLPEWLQWGSLVVKLHECRTAGSPGGDADGMFTQQQQQQQQRHEQEQGQQQQQHLGEQLQGHQSAGEDASLPPQLTSATAAAVLRAAMERVLEWATPSPAAVSAPEVGSGDSSSSGNTVGGGGGSSGDGGGGTLLTLVRGSQSWMLRPEDRMMTTPGRNWNQVLQGLWDGSARCGLGESERLELLLDLGELLERNSLPGAQTS